MRFEYEWHDLDGQWYRTHGNEHWEFDDDGLMRRRDMSANDYPIEESERRYRHYRGRLLDVRSVPPPEALKERHIWSEVTAHIVRPRRAQREEPRIGRFM
jgi:hypothetical protein